MNFIEVIDRTAMGCLMVTLHAVFALLIWLIFRGGAEDRQQVRGWWLALVMNGVGSLILAFRWNGEGLNFALYGLASSMVFVSILQRAAALSSGMSSRELRNGLGLAFVLHSGFAAFLGWWLGLEPAAGIGVIHMLQAAAALLLVFVAMQPRQTGNSDGVRMIAAGYGVYAFGFALLGIFAVLKPSGVDYYSGHFLLPMFMGAVITSVVSNMGFVWMLAGPFDQDRNQALRFQALQEEMDRRRP
jgi:hypothetical protein